MKLRVAAVLLAAFALSSGTGCGGGKKRAMQASKMSQLGQSKLTQGDAEGAVADLTQASRLEPKNAETRHLLGLAYWAKGTVLAEESLKLEAEKILLDSFKLRGEDQVPGDWHNNLGALYVDLRRWNEAVVELQKALKDPEYRTPERPLNNLAKSSLEQKKYAEAVEYADRALRVQPRFCMALVNKGHASKALKRYPEATEAFLKVTQVEECSAWPEPYLQLGLISLELKRPQESKPYLLKAKELDGEGPVGKEAARYLRSLGN